MSDVALTRKKRAPKHRCKRHRWHTCRRKNCRHRRHKHRRPAPKPPATATPSSPTPTPSPPTPSPVGVLTDADLHVLNRFSYGYTVALGEEATAAGGAAGWFEQQLDPQSIDDPAGADVDTWWDSIGFDHTTSVLHHRDESRPGWVQMGDYARWCLLRRIRSRRQLLETMAEFWENHLHIPLSDDGVFPYRAAYGQALRSHALGRYDDLLVTAITHPAMQISLDGANSTKRAPNENLGRELLELHTVGRGNHSEDDVKTSARILTGFRVDTWRTWNASYDPAIHWTGAVSVLGFSHDNSAPDGRPVVDAYLRHLAHHPRTAERIAHKLAVRFVSDWPSDELVAQLARVYLDHGTAIAPVLRALIGSAEFRGSARAKVRTPTDEVVATHRAIGSQIERPTTGNSAANVLLWQADAIGQMPFHWPRPDGPPATNEAWSSVSRLLASFEHHYGAAGGWWPSVDITYRTRASWLPAASVRFDDFVDHLARTLFGRPASAVLKDACSTAVSVQPATTITAEHAVARWLFPVLLSTLLDSPEHLQR